VNAAAVAGLALARPRPEPSGDPVVVVCFGFAGDRVRRQPWHVAHGIARGFAANGRPVRLFTDAEQPPAPAEYRVERVPTLFAGGRASPELRAAIAAAAPARVFVITGAVRLARLGSLLDLGAPVTLVMTSPRATPVEILRLGPATWWREREVLRGPLLDALVPGWALRRGYRQSGAASMLYLSEATHARYGAAGLPGGELLVPQVEPGALPPPPVPGTRARIAYMGPALELRGAWLALETFERAVDRGLDAELLLLLRPDGGRAGLLRLLRRVRRSPHQARVAVETRMLDAASLSSRLAPCQVCLLPFRVPVSEVPLVVLEAGLSGRRVVTLAAPGVAEYADALGGIVAPSPADLPRALISACRSPPLRRPDPAPWTSWDRAVAGLAETPGGHHPLARHRFVGLIGVDGSGKTFLLNRLSAELAEAGVEHRQVWSRFRNYLSKPLLALTRLTGHNVKAEVDGVRIGYHEFARSRPLSLLFLALQAADSVLDILFRYHLRPRPRPILGDRCVLDTLVDLAVDTGLDDLVLDRLGPRLAALLPSPRLVVLVSRSPRLIREGRPDALLDRNFARRRALYRRLADAYGIPVVENDGSPEAAVDQILRLARGGATVLPAGASPP
jgi:glycosyltransferase involved in cell wall biosynthesis/thymidylate kinase